MSRSLLDDIRNQGFQLSLRGLLRAIEESRENIARSELLNLIRRQLNGSIYVISDDIAGLMADIGKLFHPKSIIDISCGIGHLLQRCDYAEVRIGIDRNPEVVELATYLYPEVDFRVGDVLSDDIDQKFDLVISALPFGQRVRYNGRSCPIEKLLLEKALDLLNQGGAIVCLVPSSVLTTPSCEDFRKKVLEFYALDMIVSLPSGTIPNTAAQTCILVIRNGKPKERVYLAKYNQNGSEIIENFKAGVGSFHVSLSRMENRWDRHFHDPRFDYIERRLEGEEVKRLEEISNILGGYLVRREHLKADGEYLVLTPRNIRNDGIETTSRDRYIDKIDDARFSRAIVREGDVIVSLISNPTLYIYKQDDPPAVADAHVAIIRSRYNEYIRTYLQTGEGLKLFADQADRQTKGTATPRLPIHSLREIRIPILPLADLNTVSDEEIRNASLDKLNALIEELEQEYEKDELRQFAEKLLHTVGGTKSQRFVLNQPVRVEETRHYEFKEVKGSNPVGSIKSIADQYAVAFLNSEGGRIYWGIRDEDRVVVGVQLDYSQRDEIRRVVTEKLGHIQPPIAPTDYHIEFYPVYDEGDPIPDLYVVEMVVPRTYTKDLYFTGKTEVYVKTDGGKKKLIGPEIQAEILKRHSD